MSTKTAARPTVRWRRRPSPVLDGLWALLTVLPRVSRTLTALLVIYIVLASLLPLVLVLVSGALVGSVPASVAGGWGSVAANHMLTLLGVAAVMIASERVLTPFGASMAAVFGRRVDRYLQERTMEAVGRPHGIAHLEDPAVLDLIESARGVNAQGFRPGDAVAALASLVPSWAQALGGGAILVWFHWWLGAAWLIVWPVLLYALQNEYLRAGQVGYGQTAALRRADYYRDLALHAPAAKEIRLWGMSDWLIERFESAWNAAMIPLWRARKPGRRVVWASSLTVFAANAITYGVLGLAGLRGDLSLAALAVFVQATVAVSSFRSSDDTNMVLANAALAVPRVLQLDRMLATSVHDRTVVLAANAPRDGITLHGVEFRYPGQDRAILRGVDLDIPAGRSLAIVGVNGAGKTTLVKLLCGLYEPTAGTIRVDGTDLAQVDPVGWQAHLGAIFQDFARYHLTARENIMLGAPDAPADDTMLEAAARAGAAEVIARLPRGYDTILSREYRGGMDLSGGQWQRIALARAMFAVANGATTLMLDEPTANLDVRAEAELYDRFLEMTQGRTTILISHRFSTVRRADQIVVLDDGVVVERGDHDALMALDGRYAAMFRVQAERFVEEPDATSIA